MSVEKTLKTEHGLSDKDACSCPSVDLKVEVMNTFTEKELHEMLSEKNNERFRQKLMDSLATYLYRACLQSCPLTDIMETVSEINNSAILNAINRAFMHEEELERMYETACVRIRELEGRLNIKSSNDYCQDGSEGDHCNGCY